MNEGDALKSYIDSNNIDVSDLAIKLDINRTTIYTHYKKEKLRSSLKSTYVNFFGVDIFNKNTTSENPRLKSTTVSYEGTQTDTDHFSIPMYNVPASASLVEMYGDPNDVKVIGHLNIPGATKDSFALPVHGHSMYPTLENGSWCILRPISDVQDIEWGEIYYIEYGDYRNFKRLIKTEDEDTVTLWSDNQSELIAGKPKYASKTIRKDRLRRLCLLTDILKKPNY